MEKTSKDNLIWIPIYLGDYMKQTQDYDAEQCGLYLNFVVYYANKKGEVSSNAKINIPCKAFSDDLQIKLKEIIEQHFTENKGKFVSEYWDKIIEKQLNRIKQSREKALKRYAKEPATAVPQQCHSSAVDTANQNQSQKHNTKSYKYNNNPPTPLKSGDGEILQLTNHQKVINCYLETKNKMPFGSLPKETVQSGYRRYGRVAKALLKDTSGNVDLVCKAIRYLPLWAEAKGLDWSLETVSKALAEPMSFKLKENNIKLTDNEIKLLKGFLLLKCWDREKLKKLDISKDKYTISMIEPTRRILNIFKNDLDKAYSALKEYQNSLKEGQDFSIFLASRNIFEKYGGNV